MMAAGNRKEAFAVEKCLSDYKHLFCPDILRYNIMQTNSAINFNSTLVLNWRIIKRIEKFVSTIKTTPIFLLVVWFFADNDDAHSLIYECMHTIVMSMQIPLCCLFYTNSAVAIQLHLKHIVQLVISVVLLLEGIWLSFTATLSWLVTVLAWLARWADPKSDFQLAFSHLVWKATGC